MHTLDVVLAELVTRTAPDLLACHGVGVDTAAILLVAAGDNPERIRNEAAWATPTSAKKIPIQLRRSNIAGSCYTRCIRVVPGNRYPVIHRGSTCGT